MSPEQTSDWDEKMLKEAELPSMQSEMQAVLR